MSRAPRDDGLDALLDAIACVLPPRVRPCELHEPELRGDEWPHVRECLESGWVSTAGCYTERFESALAESAGVEHAVVTQSGTAALHLALLLTGVGAGDDVLVPALTFVASANAVSYCGAQPHFVDCDRSTLGVDVPALRAYLEKIADRDRGRTVDRRSGRALRALLPVHTLGHPCDLDALDAVASDYGLALVYDGAAALGSEYRGRPVFARVPLAAVSFNGNKIATTGGGGALLTRESELARQARHLSQTARVLEGGGVRHDRIGFNYRMPALNAALGCGQLARLADRIERKRRLAGAYFDALAGVEGIELVREPAQARSNYWLNALVLVGSLRGRRAELLDRLHALGIRARAAWDPLHTLPMYTGAPHADLPVTDSCASNVLCLPSSPRLAMPAA
jgi:perosamine synthetase